MFSLTFSGHETFSCRHYWLKKGIDFVADKRKFSAPDSVVHLGVGNNMVRSIRYWMKAFDLFEEKEGLTDLGQWIFSDDGWDPYLEDEGTLWLLHYLLNKKQHASIYSIVFCELRRQKPEFTRNHFLKHVLAKKDNLNKGTLETDFSVFSRTYLNDRSKDVEDGYSGLLADLNLLTGRKTEVMEDGKERKDMIYHIENKERPEIPAHIILYVILNNERYGQSVSFDNLHLDADGLGTIFALNKEGLMEHLQRVAGLYPRKIFFNNDPLIRELQFKGKRPEPFSVLEDYYASNP